MLWVQERQDPGQELPCAWRYMLILPSRVGDDRLGVLEYSQIVFHITSAFRMSSYQFHSVDHDLSLGISSQWKETYRLALQMHQVSSMDAVSWNPDASNPEHLTMIMTLRYAERTLETKASRGKSNVHVGKSPSIVQG